MDLRHHLPRAQRPLAPCSSTCAWITMPTASSRTLADRRRRRAPRRALRVRRVPRCPARRYAPIEGGAATHRKPVAAADRLAPALINEKNLRISDHTFFFKLLRDRGLIVGRLDTPSRDRSQPLKRGTGVRPGNRGDHRAVHDGRARVHEREPRCRRAGALRGALSTRRAVELESRRGQGHGFACHPDLSRAPTGNPRLRVLMPATARPPDAYTRPTRRWPSSRSRGRPGARRAPLHDTSHMIYTREADMMKLKRNLEAWLAAYSEIRAPEHAAVRNP